MRLDKTETSRHTLLSDLYMTRAIHLFFNDKSRFRMMPIHPDEMMSAEQDPDPDSAATDDSCLLPLGYS